MATPTFMQEGCRIGGATEQGIAMVGRTDSNGVRLFLDIYADAERVALVVSSQFASLTSDNNYQATAYVTGLVANREYWWRARADDGAGNSVVGVQATATAGKCRTLPSSNIPYKVAIIGDRAWGPYRSTTINANTIKIDAINTTVMALQPDFLFMHGDCYYSDIGSTSDIGAYNPMSWYNPVTNADATLEKYRSNFITTQSITPSVKMLHANVPTYYMTDDHDRAVNDCSSRATATGDLLARWNNGRQSSHECFMGLNKALIDTDGVREWTHNVSEESYYCVDIGIVRWVVIDCRTFRDLHTSTDTFAKSMLGATQKAWLLDKISTNPKPFLVIVNPLMLDGYHGWNESTDDGWVGYSYERDEIIAAIHASGKAKRTIIASGDTHVGCVATYIGADVDNDEIYEITAGHCWIPSYHGYVNGWMQGATGLGGAPKLQFIGPPCVLAFDVFSDKVRVSVLDAITRRAIWSKLFI